jgi:hypothetical protein
VERLVTLSRVQLGFDPVEWLRVIQAEMNAMWGVRTAEAQIHMRILGIYRSDNCKPGTS